MGRGARKVSARTLGTPIGIMVTAPLRAAWRGDSCAARNAAAGAISNVSSAWNSMASVDTLTAAQAIARFATLRQRATCGGWHPVTAPERHSPALEHEGSKAMHFYAGSAKLLDLRQHVLGDVSCFRLRKAKFKTLRVKINISTSFEMSWTRSRHTCLFILLLLTTLENIRL